MIARGATVGQIYTHPIIKFKASRRLILFRICYHNKSFVRVERIVDIQLRHTLLPCKRWQFLRDLVLLRTGKDKHIHLVSFCYLESQLGGMRVLLHVLDPLVLRSVREFQVEAIRADHITEDIIVADVVLGCVRGGAVHYLIIAELLHSLGGFQHVSATVWQVDERLVLELKVGLLLHVGVSDHN